MLSSLVVKAWHLDFTKFFPERSFCRCFPNQESWFSTLHLDKVAVCVLGNAGTRAPFGRSIWLDHCTIAFWDTMVWTALHQFPKAAGAWWTQVRQRPGEDTTLDIVLHSVTPCDTVWHCLTQSATVWHNVKLPKQRPKAIFRPSLYGDRDRCQVTRYWTMAIGGLPSTTSMDRDWIQALLHGVT